MENLFEIAASIIGLIIYWTLSNKNKQKTKPSQGPNEVNPPLPPRKKPVVVQEDDDDDDALRYEPVTFEELLEQFGDAKKKTTPSRMEREAKFGIDDEFIPATNTNQQAELEQYYKEHHDEGFTITASDLEDKRSQGFELDRKKQNYYAKLLQDPKNIRDALIMKEIFDRKYF
ncbi:MAG: hypothetical protein ACPGJS_15745 [Flammeovirgaceae bacterium]